MIHIVKYLYKFRCQVCFHKGNIVHHIDYNEKNNSLSNLIYLCKNCYDKVYTDKEKWKDYFKSLTYILVTGSEGMIGKELTILLKNNNIRIKRADLKLGIDLRNFSICKKISEGISECYMLAGVKGSPKMTQERPVDFLVPMLQFNTNMLEACRINNVKKVLYTSSIAVLNYKTDKFPAFAKKASELQIDAYKIQYPKFGNNCFIVRPANVFGRFDNFDNQDAMVVTSLVRKAVLDDEIKVWGDGSEEREFISAKDVARGMILTMNKMPNKPVNLGSNKTHTIKELAEILSKLSHKPIKYALSEKRGDQLRVVYNDEEQEDIGFSTLNNFERDIKETYNWAKYNFYKLR